MRDLLENEIIKSANNGDTTVLSELLTLLSDKQVYNALSDKAQETINKNRFYYEVHITGKNGFSTCIISDIELDDSDVILKGYTDDKLHDDDCNYIDYVDELSFDEWNTHFNFN